MRSRQIHTVRQRVALGDGDDEAQVGADEAVLGVSRGGDGVLQGYVTLAVGQLLGGLTTSLDECVTVGVRPRR